MLVKTGLLNFGLSGDPDLAKYMAVQTRFLALGGQIVTGQVESVRSQGENDVFIELKSNMTRRVERLTFDRTVISAGPWTSKLAPQLSGLLSSRLTPVTYWRDTSGSCSAADGFPILFNARLTDIYGIPSCEYPGRSVFARSIS